MNEKVYFHANKQHSRAQIDTIEKHNTRTAYCANVDSSKTKDNIVIIDRHMSHNQYLEKRLTECGFKTKANPNGKTFESSGHNARVIAVDGIITVCDPNVIENNAKFNIPDFCKYAKKWAEDTFGKENIAHMVYHGDERSPHIHIVIIPLTVDGRLSAKDVLGNDNNMSHFQDTVAEYMKPLGLMRGERYSAGFHEDTRRGFYSAAVKAQADELEPRRADESDEAFTRRVNKHLREVKSIAFRKVTDAHEEVEKERTLRIQAQRENHLEIAQEKIDKLTEQIKEMTPDAQLGYMIRKGKGKLKKDREFVLDRLCDEAKAAVEEERKKEAENMRKNGEISTSENGLETEEKSGISDTETDAETK